MKKQNKAKIWLQEGKNERDNKAEQTRQGQVRKEKEKSKINPTKRQHILVTTQLGWLRVFVAFQPSPADIHSVASPPIRETALMRDLTAHK